MKFLAVALVCLPASWTFSPSAPFVRRASVLGVGSDPNVFLGGNTWKPDSEKMGSTDTGDFFPEGYNPNEQIAFTEGMKGSQDLLAGGNRGGPQLPGMENLGADAIITGGIQVSDEIPPGMEFIPSSVPDQTVEFNVASSSGGLEVPVEVKPVCMTFEDYFAAFAPGSNPSFSVSPATGRMDRRGGEPSILMVRCEPKGQAGTLEGNLVINLPEDNSKITVKVKAMSF